MAKGDADKDRQAEAARIMREAGRSETVGTSLLARTTESLRSADDPNDPATVWGKRIGRALGIVAFLLLAAYLIAQYGPR